LHRLTIFSIRSEADLSLAIGQSAKINEPRRTSTKKPTQFGSSVLSPK
jgi:hypothetical protein